MSDLPNMLKGPIALEYSDTVHTAWMAYDEKKPKPEHTHDKGCPEHTHNSCPPCEDTAGGGDTCSSCKSNGDCAEKKKAAFHPAVAGWMAPPPLPPA